MSEHNPNPGSQEALDKGCICPVLDNEYGSYERTGGYFTVRLDCTIHGDPEPQGDFSGASEDPEWGGR